MKKQIFKGLVITIMAITISSCSNNNQTAETSSNENKIASVDSLINSFNNAWNVKDSKSIENMFSNSIVYFNGGRATIGKDSIMKYLVGRGLNDVENLKTIKMSEFATNELALFAGKWSATNKNDSISLNEGNISILWKKQSDNSWKMELMHINTLGK
jgi:ketosteroid isomerase-like protein